MKLAQRVGVASALLAVLAFANASNFGANAEGVVSETTVNLIGLGSEVKGATAVLTRLETGVSMKLNKIQLEPGHAYTIWWDVSGSTERADGHVIDSNGAARFEASLLKTSEGVLQDPMGAEIRLVVRNHGLADPGRIDAMTYTMMFGCPCLNVQHAVFKPPTSAAALAQDSEMETLMSQEVVGIGGSAPTGTSEQERRWAILRWLSVKMNDESHGEILEAAERFEDFVSGEVVGQKLSVEALSKIEKAEATASKFVAEAAEAEPAFEE